MKNVVLVVALIMLLNVISFGETTDEMSNVFYPNVEKATFDGITTDSEQFNVNESINDSDGIYNRNALEIYPSFADKRCSRWEKESSETICEQKLCSNIFARFPGTITYTWWKRECVRYKDGFIYTEYDLRFKVLRCSC